MARKKFLRGKWRTYSKLGRGRKKKQKYRKPRGRHNKIREKMKGNPRKVSIGYKKPEKKKRVIVIFNIQGLLELNRGEKIILAKIGNKKKLEIVKKAEEKGIEIVNLNIKKFLNKIKKQIEEKEKKKKEKTKNIKGKKGKKKEEKKTEQVEEKKEEKEKQDKSENLEEKQEEKNEIR